MTALSANILYLDSLGTERVNLRGRMFYMRMLRFFRSFRICKQNFSILNINDAMPRRVETRQAISALLDAGKRPLLCCRKRRIFGLKMQILKKLLNKNYFPCSSQ